LLVLVLRHPAFLAGQTDTAFLTQHWFDDHGRDSLAAPLISESAAQLSALAAALADAAARQATAKVLGGLPSGWRNVPSQLQRKTYERVIGSQPEPASAAARYEIGYRIDRAGLTVDGRDDVRLVTIKPDLVELEAVGVLHRFEVAAYKDLVCVDSGLGPVALRPVPRFTDPAAQAAPGSLRAPMPGTVARVGVTIGDHVTRGQPLLWLEAMKMEHVISAPAAGIVTELPVAAGEQVEVGSVLAVVKPEEEPQ
jgi:propionyl-CoA carboxylase alpha chain